MPATVKLLLDTGYCLYLIKERPRQLQAAFNSFAPGDIGVSSLTVAALESYVQASRHPAQNRRALEQFLLPLEILDFDAEAARRLADTGAHGVWHGGSVHTAMLAAHALRLDATLVTREPERYAGIPWLRVQLDVGTDPLAATSVDRRAAPAPVRQAGPAAAPHTIVMTGSHDLSVDLLAEWIHRRHPALVLAAAPVGSMTGLLALRHHEAHLAGSHLFDPDTGEFNTSYVAQLLVPFGVHAVLVGFVTRVQGLIVRQGNPKSLHSLADLVRDDVVFVNRQEGAGTRILLDYHLQQQGIDPAHIHGYDHLASTHLAVATAVSQGRADCALGIQAAAQAMALDFVPLFEECFDLVIPVEHYHAPLLAPLLDLLRRPDAEFIRQVQQLGGYGTARMGRLLAEL